jgi:hypothetical protein
MNDESMADDGLDYVKDYYASENVHHMSARMDEDERFGGSVVIVANGSKKRGCFPKNATNKLKHWLFQNLTVWSFLLGVGNQGKMGKMWRKMRKF